MAPRLRRQKTSKKNEWVSGFASNSLSLRHLRNPRHTEWRLSFFCFDIRGWSFGISFKASENFSKRMGGFRDLLIRWEEDSFASRVSTEFREWSDEACVGYPGFRDMALLCFGCVSFPLLFFTRFLGSGEAEQVHTRALAIDRQTKMNGFVELEGLHV